MNKIYIAYGSNMNVQQMAYRCPNAKFYATGTLKGWRLIFRGSKTGAYATIEKCDNSSVPVVIWQITPNCERSLDFYEGHPTFYKKRIITAEYESGSIQGMVYIMDERYKPERPSYNYIGSVRQGYIDNHIDTQSLVDALTYNEHECKF